MARKQIKSEELISKDLFSEQIRQAMVFKESIEALLTTFKELGKQSADKLSNIDKSDPKNIKETNAELQKANEIIKQLTKLTDAQREAKKKLTEAEQADLKNKKEQEGLQKKLIALDSDQAKKTAQLRVQIQEKNKANRDSAKESLKLEGAYARESKRLNDLRKKYKDLAIEGRANGKVARGLASEIQSLDKRLKEVDASTGQYQRNVGNYSSAFGGAAQASGLFSKQINALNRAKEVLNAITQKNTVAQEAENITTVQATVADTAETASTTVLTTAKTAETASTTVLTTAKTAETTATTAQATATSRLTIIQRAAALASGVFSNGLKILKVALISTGIGALVVGLGALVAAFSTTQRGADAFTKVLRPIGAIIQRFLGYLQNTGFAIFDRLKEAFENPTQAIKDLGNAILENLINRIKSLSVFGKAIGKLFSGDITGGFKALGDATVQLTLGITNATDKIENLAKKTKTFIDESLKQGEEIDALIKKLDRNQIDSIVPLAKARLEFEKFNEISKDQAKSSQERLTALKESIALQRFINKTEENLLNTEIKILKLKQSQNDTDREGERELQELLARKLESETEAQKKINALVSKRSGIEKRALKDTEDKKKAESDILELKKKELVLAGEIKKLTDKEAESRGLILKADQRAVESSKKAVDDRLQQEKEAQEELRSYFQQTSQFLQRELDRRTQAELSQSQAQLTDQEKRVQRQQELAQRGLANTLQFEEEKLAQAELKQQELEEQRIRREKVIAYYRLLSSEALKEGATGSSVLKAASTIASAELVARALTGFADGGYTGDGQGTADKSGHKIAGVVHANEYVVPKKILETPIGASMVESLEGLRKGKMIEPIYNLTKTEIVNRAQNVLLQNELRGIRDEIRKQKQVTVQWDSFDNRIEKIKTDTFERTIKHVRKRSRL